MVGTARGDPDDPTRVVAHTEGSERPGAMPAEPRVLHLPSQDVGRPGAAVDPIVPVQHDTRAIAPMDKGAAAGSVELRDPAVREGFVNYVRNWTRSVRDLSSAVGELPGPYHGP